MTQFLHSQQVIAVHDLIISEVGGRGGLMNLGLLHSAVETPKSTMDGCMLHPTLFDQAAAYLFHICQNHPFLDGNKRTALASALIFLANNDVVPLFDEFEIEELVVETAKGKVNKRQLANYLSKSQVLTSTSQ